MRPFVSPVLLLLAAIALAACASKQRVALDCVPHEVTVYVDGRQLEKTPEAIELSSDEPHTVFFKGGGYQPQMVVLESEEVDGESRLSPPDVCSHTVFAEMRPELELKLDPEVSEGPP